MLKIKGLDHESLFSVKVKSRAFDANDLSGTQGMYLKVHNLSLNLS